MRARKLVGLAAIATALAVLPSLRADDAAVQNFKIDPVHSTAIFRVKHLGASWFYGRFNEVGGAFKVDEKNPAGSSIEVEIKVESVDTHDAKRDAHLKAPDFFNAKQFPSMTFKSKEVKAVDKDVFEVAGDLTLHGVTKPLTVKVERAGAGKDPWGGYRMGFETTFTLKRSDYGMNYMPEALGEDIRVILSVEGMRT
ncbi:MAG: YceI family protein [Planctomycetes bacterium]|nr:YceI family protein [Planctomycetota bacterium]